jgi:very-short-patch-repair endonuclease
MEEMNVEEFRKLMASKKGSGSGSSKEDLEIALLTQIRQLQLEEPLREFMAIKKESGRSFRWDFAWPDHRLLVEIQGDIWAGKRGEESGHTSGVGLLRDYEKNNLAVYYGWRVLFFASNTIHSGEAVNQIEQFLKLDRPNG